MAKAGRAAATWRAYREVSRPGSPGLMTRVRALPRMIRGSMRGDYPGLSRSKLGMLGLAVAYIISPVDVIPDFFIGIGVVDDFGVFLWLMTSLLGESGQYVQWERGRMHRGGVPRGIGVPGDGTHRGSGVPGGVPKRKAPRGVR
jgi:uncharacterized membrane protein YkvA (DUF1232 family)